VAFPWDNLILAASTLGAALGSAGMTSYLNRKDRAAESERKDVSDHAERQAAAYQAVVASAAVMQHNYSQRWGEFDDLTAAEQLSIRSREP
jgi:menaquinone-dependent protoporphyrinogen IX oxidase